MDNTCTTLWCQCHVTLVNHNVIIEHMYDIVVPMSCDIGEPRCDYRTEANCRKLFKYIYMIQITYNITIPKLAAGFIANNKIYC